MSEVRITVYPMKCPICKLYKEFLTEEARDKYVDDHVRKCIEINKKLVARESGAALEAIEHIKASSKPAPGEVPKEWKELKNWSAYKRDESIVRLR